MERKKPAYLTLYEALRQEITDGVWPFGTRLPSRRQTARDRGVSVITVALKRMIRFIYIFPIMC